MSNTRSDSSESISIYETPINSPSNESLLDSTRIDSSLFGNTSATTQSLDFIDFRQSLESISTSVATELTLKRTAQRLNRDCVEDNHHLSHSSVASHPDPVWRPSSQTMSDLRNHLLDSNKSDIFVNLRKYMTELENEELELIGIEQQISSLSLRCRSIRENMSSKTYAINSLITQLLPQTKTMAQKQTQTDLEVNQPIGCSYDKNDSLLSPFIQSVAPKSDISLSESQVKTEMVSPKTNSSDLCESLKKKFGRLPAMVKGYLTRRLMKTDKVLQKIETIRDTTQLLSTYSNPSIKKITNEDLNFHKRLMIQLENSCHELYDIFFNYPKSSQMALIRRSREHILDRHYRTASVLSNSSYMNASFRNQSSPQTKTLSSVTKKVIQRKGQKSRTNLSSSHSKSQNSSAKSRTPSSVKQTSDRCVRRSQRTANTASNAVQTNKRKANFDK